jgi:hypothetical protein
LDFGLVKMLGGEPVAPKGFNVAGVFLHRLFFYVGFSDTPTEAMPHFFEAPPAEQG